MLMPLRLRGFTLIEIMVVVVIMGVLAALLVPRLMGRADDARILAAKQDIATLMQALKLYRLDNQRLPTTEQGLQALVVRPTVAPLAPNWKTGGYLDRLNKDPWGNPYQYLAPGLHGEVDVFSYGADGKPGGIGVDADIGSWMEQNNSPPLGEAVWFHPARAAGGAGHRRYHTRRGGTERDAESTPVTVQRGTENRPTDATRT